jgi:F-type H+-transporting ATPase subunit delta
MSKKAAGAREARALLEVATRESDPERVGAELDVIAEAMRTQPEVQALLLGPGVAVARKVQALEVIASSLGLTPLVSKLLAVFAERQCLRLIPELAAAYQVRLLERRNIVSASITTAVPLSAETADRVGRALGQASGKQVMVSTRVDPHIIGGAVARIGSTVYDGSVTTQLARMRQKLVENA